FLTEGGPANSNYQFAGSTDLLITWLFTLTVDNRLYNIGAVMSIVIFVLVGTFSLWTLKRSRAFDELGHHRHLPPTRCRSHRTRRRFCAQHRYRRALGQVEDDPHPHRARRARGRRHLPAGVGRRGVLRSDRWARPS